MARGNTIRQTALIFCLGIPCLLKGAPPPAKPVFIYASLAGRPTYDDDAQGGNPFATSVVELLSRRKPISFTTFQADLITLTQRNSRGAQQAEIVGGDYLSQRQFLPRSRNQTWVALVVVFSNYSDSGLGLSLPGAKRDSKRIAVALSQAGFIVTQLTDPDRNTLARVIKDFANSSVSADVSVIYTTGHGVEVNGVARILLPYTRSNNKDALTVLELARSARARFANLIFYAACRTEAR